MPETKNKTFEEIAHQFSPGDHLEVEEMVDDTFEEPPEFPQTTDDDMGEPEDNHLVTLNFGGGGGGDNEVKTPDGNDVRKGNDVTVLPRTGNDASNKETPEGVPLLNMATAKEDV